ncbi:hypothetical protein IT408_03945 [Candidatus Uhrbacteria bacterium]|nr:hypothetical protein [Candidatus Uhrbacteria bacterium]
MKRGIVGSDIFLLRILFVLGIVLIFVAFAFTSYLTVRFLPHISETERDQSIIRDSNSVPETNTGFLGEMGSSCGGVKRLPCKPGLICDAPTDGVSQGSCVKDPKAQKGKMPLQFGEVCGADLPVCGPGLFCREDAQNKGLMFCSKLNEQAPFIVSVKAEGMFPAEGGYHAPAETKITFHVQATNAERVVFKLDDKILGEAKKNDGGKFDYVWKIPINLDGVIDVIAYRGVEFSSARLSIQADR